MPIDPAVVPSIISAASGLLGVIVGGGITTVREMLHERHRRAKEAKYATALIEVHLERFIDACVNVAGDDGTVEGSPAGEDGTYLTTVSKPVFDPLAIEVEWKSLSTDLMFAILNIPSRAEELDRSLRGKHDFDSAPEYTEFFWARQRGYAKLGLEAIGILERLKCDAGVPLRAPIDVGWNRSEFLGQRIEEISKEETASRACLAAGHQLLGE